MDTNALLDKFEARKLQAAEFMEKLNKGFILNDETISPYDPKEIKKLEELQKLVDDYGEMFSTDPVIGMFTIARQTELLNAALKSNTVINTADLL